MPLQFDRNEEESIIDSLNSDVSEVGEDELKRMVKVCTLFYWFYIGIRTCISYFYILNPFSLSDKLFVSTKIVYRQ